MTLADKRTITLWDSSERPPKSGAVLHWSGYARSGNEDSLFRYCDSNAERLREEYCRWVFDLGEYQINGVRIVDHLALDDRSSYWWMTRLAEQSPWKSPAINTAIRLLALEEILVTRKPLKVILVSANVTLHEVVSGLCSRIGIDYEWTRLHRSPKWPELRDVYRSLPLPVQAVVSFIRDIKVRWPLRGSVRADWCHGEKSLFLCSYFMYMSLDEANKGHFRSAYWGGLNDLLPRLHIGANWLQLYREHDSVPSSNAALNMVEGFNRNRQTEGVHGFLDSYLSWGLVLRVLRRWVRLLIASWRIRQIRDAFQPASSQLSLWPIMREDWFASVQGPDSIGNILSIELFDRALSDLPRQRLGLYLCENQAWERALLVAWRKHGHGRIVAVPHSTQSFWDLRYFQDIRMVRSSSPRSQPRPDMTAVNGPAALKTFLSGNHPRQTIMECEALRYGHLQNMALRHARLPGDSIRVLILGEYLSSGTANMLKLLEASRVGADESAVFFVKPHPNCPVRSDDYPALKLTVINDPLKNVLHEFDVAYVSSMTSAAVDAYFSGLPVVIALDDGKLNYSPLRGRRGVRFVGTPEELRTALQAPAQWSLDDRERSDYFLLDPDLRRWKELLLLP